MWANEQIYHTISGIYRLMNAVAEEEEEALDGLKNMLPGLEWVEEC